MIIESVAAAGAILSTISTAINKLNEVGDGAAKAVELMQGFSDALDSFEREKKDSIINNLSSQELLKLERIKHRRDKWEKSLRHVFLTLVGASSCFLICFRTSFEDITFPSASSTL